MSGQVCWTTYSPRERHGGAYPNRTVTITGQEYLSMCFECVCGEPLMDGDRVLKDDHFVHVNCAELVGVA